MADENISDELHQELERVVKSFRGSSMFVSDTMNEIIKKIGRGEKIRQSEFDAFTKELKEARYGMRKFVNDVIDVGGAFTNVSGQMGRGTASFDILKDTVDLATTAFSKVAEGAGALIGGTFGPIGTVIGKKLGAASGELAKVAGEIAKYLIDIFDDAQKTFTNLSQVGAFAAGGVDDMTEQFGRLQVPMQDFEKIVKSNSHEMALLSGTVSGGIAAMTSSFLRMEQDAGQTAQKMRNLGFSTTEITDTMISYADMQRRIGAQDYMDTEKLRTGTMAYGKELDLLARITGKTREQAQQAMNQALLNERFQAKLRQMQANGQSEAAKELQLAVRTQIMMGNKQMAEAIMSGATGFYTTPEARSMAAAMPGFIDNVNGLARGTQDVAQFTQRLQDSSKVYEEQFRGLTLAIGADSPVTKQYLEAVNLSTAAQGKIGEAIDNARANIDEAANAPTPKTENLTKTIRSIERATARVQYVLMDDKVGFTKLMEKAARGIETFTKYVTDAVKEWGEIDQGPKTATVAEKTKVDKAVLDARMSEAEAHSNLEDVLKDRTATVDELRKAEKKLLDQQIAAAKETIQQNITRGVPGFDNLDTGVSFSKPQQETAERLGVVLPKTRRELLSTPTGPKLNAVEDKVSPSKQGPKLNAVEDKVSPSKQGMQQILEEQKKSSNEQSKAMKDLTTAINNQKPMSEETGQRVARAVESLPGLLEQISSETRKNGMYTRNA